MIKLLEGFAGIGSVAMALEKLNISYTGDVIEWNIYSTIAYAAVHNNSTYLKEKENLKHFNKKELNDYLSENYSDKEGNPLFSRDGKKPMTKYSLEEGLALKLCAAVKSINNFVDISKVSLINKEPYDLFWHSSPCQNFSVAGNNLGGNRGSGTSSSLLFESVRLITENRPKVVIWENVKGALTPKHIHNVEEYKDELTKLGYKHTMSVISGNDIGWVQLRPRVFIYSYLDEVDKVNLTDILHKTYPQTKLEDVIDFTKDSLLYEYNASTRIRNSQSAKDYLTSKGLDYKNTNYLFDSCLSPSRTSRASFSTAPTLLTSKRLAKHSKVTGNESVLTSREYWDLMSFPSPLYDKAKSEVIDNQIYKICGNSVLVCVIEEILKLNKNFK